MGRKHNLIETHTRISEDVTAIMSFENPYDTTVSIEGKFSIAGADRQAFVVALGKLIDAFRI